MTFSTFPRSNTKRETPAYPKSPANLPEVESETAQKARLEKAWERFQHLLAAEIEKEQQER